MEKKVTIIDIAKELMISPSTVSRALANNSRVSEKTKAAIKAKAEEMGYQPNIMASSLRKGKTNTIGMVVPRINRHFFSNVISGVEKILKPAGYNLIITQTGESYEGERDAVKTLIENRVSGVIVSLSLGAVDLSHLKELENLNIPLVQFDRTTPELKGPRVVNDNFKAGYSATKHLIDNGFTKIAHFAGALNIIQYHERYDGYREALKDAGIKEEITFEEVITRETGYQTVISNSSKIDAIFCASDYSALGALDAIKKLKSNIGVIGCANEPFAEIMSPSLSSIKQHAAKIGELTAEIMLTQIECGITDQIEVVPTELIERKSSKKI